MTHMQPTGEANRNHRHRQHDRRGARRAWARLSLLGGAIWLAVFALTRSAAGQSILEPAGKGAREVEDLWWLMFWLGAAIFVLVMLLLAVALVLRHSHDHQPGLSRTTGHSLVIVGGIVMPFIVLAIVFGYTLYTLTGLASDGDERYTVDVIGHQWWWEVRYPDADVVTANEIHIPVGEPVQFRVTSADVIHSFWVPSLHGKIDLLPGSTNSITITAERTGRYRGQCAQFCGVQHANMAFYVIADKPDAFSNWLDQQSQPAEAAPAGSLIARGEDVFLNSACLYCHAVRGTTTPATGRIGPDLTHLASRQTIAAGVLNNNPGSLAGWIIDPQQIKPGTAMPTIGVSREDATDIAAYLYTIGKD